MSSYPTYPTGGPPLAPVGRPDRTGTVAAAVIGVVCLLSTIAVIAFTSDDLPAEADQRPGSPQGGPSVDVTAVPPAELKRSFPLPPGAGPSHLGRDVLPTGIRAFDVRAPVGWVRKFYERRLAQLGYAYDSPSASRDRASGRVVGWAGSITVDDEFDAVAFLSLNVDYLGGGPGVVTIQVTFHG